MVLRVTTTLDMALGSLIALAAAAFGVVGLLIGLRDNPHTIYWFLGSAVLGVLSSAVLLDEAATARRAGRRLEAWLGTLLLLTALVAGAIGFVLGLINRANAQSW